MFDLTGHVALVTGGNGGIGLSYAKGLIKAGAKVAIWGRNEKKNSAAISKLRELGDDVEAFTCDVMNSDNIKTAFEETMVRFGQVDSCFANAGGPGAKGPLIDLCMDDWQSGVDLNLNSVINTYKPVIKQLIARGAPGKLIVTSSIAAGLGIAMATNYSATKASVLGLTRGLAVELGRNNIQVNAISPGYIETELSLDTPQFFKDGVKRRTASGVTGSLEDVEGIAVFLASQESKYITGQNIVIDGGQSIYGL